MRKRKHRLKNIILKGIICVLITALLVSGCLLDSNYLMPALIVFMFSLAVLTMFAYANGLMD